LSCTSRPHSQSLLATNVDLELLFNPRLLSFILFINQSSNLHENDDDNKSFEKLIKTVDLKGKKLIKATIFYYENGLNFNIQ
jgi:hypothetical protein